MSADTQATVITEPGIYELDESIYHADPVPGGSLSSTGARRILDSPARFRWEREHPRTSKAFDIGTAVHAKVLGVGARVIGYPEEHLTPSGSVSTKAATVAWVDEQRSAGIVILPAADLATVNAMAEAVLAHAGARRLLELPGTPEASVFSTDPDTGVNVRARFDRLSQGVAVDLKTTAGSAGPRFASDAAKYGYPIQEAHYADTLAWATGNDERVPVAFIVVEKKPPHLVAVHYFDDITRMVARELAAKARATYAECVATNAWPGYSADPYITQVPGWWLDQAEDQEEMVI